MGRQFDSWLDTCVNAYVTCALWSSSDQSDDGGGVPLDDDRYGEAKLTAEARATMRDEVDAFIAACDAAELNYLGEVSAEDMGHDLWLTRNGHGAGFWDRDLGDLGDKLTALAKAAGERDLYVGDDGYIHHSGG